MEKEGWCLLWRSSSSMDSKPTGFSREMSLFGILWVSTTSQYRDVYFLSPFGADEFKFCISSCMHQNRVVSFNRKCNLLFLIEKAVVSMETADQMGDLYGSVLPKGPPCDSLCHYVNAINGSPRNIGKEGKFQLFVCLGIR